MRRAAGLLAVGLLATAVVEVAVFVLVARWWGFPLALLVAVGTCAVGALLLRREGVRGWRRFRQAFDAGRPPGAGAADGLVGLAGALLLTVPGLVTDVLGALLLVPPVRAVAAAGVRRAAERRMSARLAGDVFGPRRVRARQGRPRPAGPPSGTSAGPDLGAPAGPSGGTEQAGTPLPGAAGGATAAGPGRAGGDGPAGPGGTPGARPAAGWSGGGAGPTGPSADPGDTGPVIEGEIVDPGDRP